MTRASCVLTLIVVIGLAATTPVLAQQPAENPEAALLVQRLHALDSVPDHAGLAALERLRAQQAIDAFVKARRGEIATALQVAQWRVETAELAVQTETIQRQIQVLERERGELLLEASRREAARARQEAERLRRAVEAEAQARQEAEGVLDTVASDQVERARAARQRAAELKAQEEALRRRLEEDQD